MIRIYSAIIIFKDKKILKLAEIQKFYSLIFLDKSRKKKFGKIRKKNLRIISNKIPKI